ncbi:MAG: hypothetical protein M1832_000315 [Thelocarpon impressellum]|nr:MAG: hypothetical protein M1832_000315 [Thelocarpon impressellum]
MSEQRPPAARRTSSAGRRKLEAFYDLGFLRKATRERSRSRPRTGPGPDADLDRPHRPLEDGDDDFYRPAAAADLKRADLKRPALRSAFSSKQSSRYQLPIPPRTSSAYQVRFGIDAAAGPANAHDRPTLAHRPRTSGSGKQASSAATAAAAASVARPPLSSSRSLTERPLYERAFHDRNHQTSFSWRAGGNAGIMDLERTRTRRERTFVGAECAVCEEPLEHTLRGERILQFSCGHVAHEACFYEFLRETDSQFCPTCNAPLGLDTSRGGNVLDLEKLSSIVRSAPPTDYVDRGRPVAENADTHERTTSRDSLLYSHRRQSRESRDRIQRFGSYQGPAPVTPTTGTSQAPSAPNTHHARADSGHTGIASSGEIPENEPIPAGRRHDYDVHSMETNISSPRASVIKNPIPPPTVTVRSEFPTLNRSRQQQTLTCLVTVEVPHGKWRPDPEDLRGAPPPTSARPDEGAPGVPETPSRPNHQSAGSVEPPEVLDEVTEDLRARVENWHGLDFQRFGNLRLYGTIRVGKDRQSWQELECYLFAEMLICVKEKKVVASQRWDDAASKGSKRKNTKCTLKGSILIKKHLKQVSEATHDQPVLTLSLSVAELPSFHLQFQNRTQLELWRRALLELHDGDLPATRGPSFENTDNSETDEEEYRLKTTKRVSSVNSSWGPNKSVATAPTEYTNSAKEMPPSRASPLSIHVPIDLVVVIPISSSMQGLKISLLRDALKFLVQNLGDRDRMGLVTFGSGGGGVPMVGMTTKAWGGWSNVLNSIRPVGQKSLRADVVDGANVAMDLLMQRKTSNPIGTILLISDSSTSEAETVDFVVSRAEAAKVTIHSFGLGLTHKPDTMIELSSRTKASYTYVKDWMMLRDCVAGCLGSMETLSHQNAKLRLKLPEGSPAKFVKISGALHSTRRAAGKDAEAVLGDLRFGDKRDVLVQLVIAPDITSPQELPQDPWETIVSGLEAFGGPWEPEEGRPVSVEEVPLIQAEVNYNDILRQGTWTQTRPSLLAITMLPATSKVRQSGRPITPPIPPHPSIVQRRMELLTSDMLTKALTLVSRGHHDRAQSLLTETRGILKGLGKGGLPPLPQSNAKSALAALGGTNAVSGGGEPDAPEEAHRPRTPSPPRIDANTSMSPGIDVATVQALDHELENSLEWIGHPAVFGRDSRKAVLQAIGVIASQRAYTFRTPAESLWAGRVPGIKRLTSRSREWREADESLMEEV